MLDVVEVVDIMSGADGFCFSSDIGGIICSFIIKKYKSGGGGDDVSSASGFGFGDSDNGSGAAINGGDARFGQCGFQ